MEFVGFECAWWWRRHGVALVAPINQQKMVGEDGLSDPPDAHWKPQPAPATGLRPDCTAAAAALEAASPAGSHEL